jgi:hypothetical protein
MALFGNCDKNGERGFPAVVNSGGKTVVGFLEACFGRQSKAVVFSQAGPNDFCREYNRRGRQDQ